MVMKNRMVARAVLSNLFLHIYRPRGSITRDLYRHRLITGARKVLHIRWLGVEAAGGESLQFLLIESRTIADVPGAGYHRRNAIVWMRMCLDLSIWRNR